VPLGGRKPDVIGLGAITGTGRHGRRHPGDPLGGEVHQHVTEPDARQVLGGADPPHHRPHPREQFLHAERLGDVVVRAGVERLHLVGAVGPAG